MTPCPFPLWETDTFLGSITPLYRVQKGALWGAFLDVFPPFCYTENRKWHLPPRRLPPDRRCGTGRKGRSYDLTAAEIRFHGGEVRLLQPRRPEAVRLPTQHQQSGQRAGGGAGDHHLYPLLHRHRHHQRGTGDLEDYYRCFDSEYFLGGADRQKPTFFVSSQHYDFVVSAFEEFLGQIDADAYTLGLNQTQTAAVIEDVRKQYSDIGVIFLSDVNRRHMSRVLEDNNLAFHPLLRSTPHAFMSIRHPLARRPQVKPEELMDYPCIVYEQNADSPAFFSEEMILPNFYPPKTVYISDLYVSTALMRHCNAYDVGTGVISPRLAQEVACVPIDTEDTVDIGWIGIQGRALRPIEETFLHCLTGQLQAAQG